MNIEQAIKDFHEKYQLAYDGPPRQLPAGLQGFRTKFMQEELDEYKEAVESGDLEKQFDALVDLVYVAVGTAYLQGFPFNAGFDMVQIANMSKVRALREEDSKRGSTYDVVKPEGWKAPELGLLIGAFHEKKMD